MFDKSTLGKLLLKVSSMKQAEDTHTNIHGHVFKLWDNRSFLIVKYLNNIYLSHSNISPPQHTTYWTTVIPISLFKDMRKKERGALVTQWPRRTQKPLTARIPPTVMAHVSQQQGNELCPSWAPLPCTHDALLPPIIFSSLESWE